MRRALMLLMLLGWTLAPLRAVESDDIVKDLKYGTLEKREAALDLVLAGRAPEAGPALLGLLSEAKGATRLKCIRALGVVGEEKAVRPLLEILSDPLPEFRIQACKALAGIGDKSAATALVPMLKDGDVEVREAAARALADCGGPGDVGALQELLTDSNRLVRMAAINSIGRLGDAKALPVLQAQMVDSDPGYKRVVIKAIGTLKGADIDASMAEWLKDSDAYLRGFTAEALARRAPAKELEPALIGLLADPALPVRVRAVETLGAWKSKAAVGSLIKTLRAEEPTLRWKGVLALGAIGDIRAKEALKYAAANDAEVEIRAAAKRALEGLKK